ncbi:hypothetical protein BC833DRAFT_105992 [Globomyces pollinis-pini]|nr:hypothetical protein BC833DRAFT_105992 [Globomyces pollinis-pini]
MPTDRFDQFIQSLLNHVCSPTMIKTNAFQLSISDSDGSLNLPGKVRKFNWIGILPNYDCLKDIKDDINYQLFNSYPIKLGKSFSTLEPKFGFHSKHIVTVSTKQKNSVVLYHCTPNYFIDPFEIDRIVFTDDLDNRLTSSIDLEAPANSIHATDQFMTSIITSTNDLELIPLTFSIPFHLRYQSTRNKKMYEPVKIWSPHLITFEKNVSYCIDPIIPLAMAIQISKQNGCMKFDKLNGDDIIQIPIGNSDMESFISVWTYVVSYLGVVLVFLFSFKFIKSRDIKEKTN